MSLSSVQEDALTNLGPPVVCCDRLARSFVSVVAATMDRHHVAKSLREGLIMRALAQPIDRLVVEDKSWSVWEKVGYFVKLGRRLHV